MSGVPEEYHEYADVFSKERADTLPDHRPYDLKIDLEDGAEPPLGQMYSLSQTEVQALCEFLDENLCIGFIRPSKAGHSAYPLHEEERQLASLVCRLPWPKPLNEEGSLSPPAHFRPPQCTW